MTEDNAPLDARLQELLLQYARGDRSWPRTLNALAVDIAANDEIHELLTSVCVFVTNLSFDHCGQQETVARFTEDLRTLRRLATKEVAEE